MKPYYDHLAVLFALLVLARVWGLAAGPPLGPPCPEPPSCPVTGRWLMHWQQGQGKTTFARDGTYVCDPWSGDGARWQGTWRLDRGVLTVIEAHAGEAAPEWEEWTVRLRPGKREGALDRGGQFKLEKP